MPSLDQTPQCSNSKCGSTSAIFQRCARCQNTMYCSRDCQAAAWPTHKATCKRRNYLVKFHLCPDDITDPPVIRTLSCPANATFYNLHRALQTAFEWAGTHSFDFTVGDSDFEPPNEEDMTAFISRMMSSQNGQPANSAREFVLRITDPAPYEPMMGMGIDRMHEGRRKHPRTPEKKANVVRLHQVLDDANYKGIHSPHKLCYIPPCVGFEAVAECALAHQTCQSAIPTILAITGCTTSLSKAALMPRTDSNASLEKVTM